MLQLRIALGHKIPEKKPKKPKNADGVLPESNLHVKPKKARKVDSKKQEMLDKEKEFKDQMEELRTKMREMKESYGIQPKSRAKPAKKVEEPIMESVEEETIGNTQNQQHAELDLVAMSKIADNVNEEEEIEE